MSSPIPVRTALKWIGRTVAGVILAAVLFIAIFGWNWLRGPIERMTAEKTGRVLAINGDIKVHFAWPWPRLQAGAVTFANPGWAREKQMFSADSVEVAVDLPQLLRRQIVLHEVRLGRPVVYLEQGSEGRKNWLLDRDQQDEGARIRIDRLTLDHGTLGYDDAGRKTRIRSELSTANTPAGEGGVTFTAEGLFKGLPLKAHGNGGSVLGLRDETTPYPLKAEITAGGTRVKIDGTITSLLRFSATDVRLALGGSNLDQLYPLIGVAFPSTRAYATEGRLVHTGSTWRYEKFSGRFGDSDLAGGLEVDTGGRRPAMKAELVSRQLDVADLGPLIGDRPGSLQAAKQSAALLSRAKAAGPPAQARVLPDLPFKTDRWDSVDAEVSWDAKAIRHATELPLENLVMHLSLRDSVLRLDPLNFGLAGGQLNAAVTLDGRANPIDAHVRLRARKIFIARLFPSFELTSTGVGQINGEFDLAGKGNSVGRMLAGADGRVGLVVAGGEISRLMMEKIGLHLWEILRLNITGDQLVKLRCGVADFAVKGGNMRAEALVFDTAVTTVLGTGSIDLGDERLDLTLNQKTKNTSPLALRSPIYIRGSFARPDVQVDKARIAVRALGAIALGVANPLLALIPLVDPGPGKDSDCRALMGEARALPRPGVR